MTARVVPEAALASLAGQEIGVSDWLLVTQVQNAIVQRSKIVLAGRCTWPWRFIVAKR